LEQQQARLTDVPAKQMHVDLDDVHGKISQTAERGISGPEVIEGDSHPQFADAFNVSCEERGGIQESRHGEFQDQIRRVEVIARQRCRDCAHRVALSHEDRRHVHDQAAVDWVIGECLLHDPVGQVNDGPTRFSHRDE